MCYHSNTQARNHARHEATFYLNQPEDRELVLDFSLNQSQTEQQFEEDVFRGFSTDECEREGEHCLKLLLNHTWLFSSG